MELIVSGTPLDGVVGLASSEAKKRLRELGREDIEPKLKGVDRQSVE